MQGQRRPDPRDQGSVLGNYGHSPPVSATYPCTVQYRYNVPVPVSAPPVCAVLLQYTGTGDCSFLYVTSTRYLLLK